MAVSLSSVPSFNSTNFQAKYQHLPRSPTLALPLKYNQVAPPKLSIYGPRKAFNNYRLDPCFSGADSNQLAKETYDEGSISVEKSWSNDQLSFKAPQSLDSQVASDKDDSSRLSGASPASTGSTLSSDPTQGMSTSQSSPSTPKRSPLTARERLRAARVRNRFTETKSSRSEMGSKVLDALKESDRGKKRSGLPEAPTNLFDDSKRGMPKKGLTFQFPGGIDLFFIVLSFALISAVMFTTTYVVWKVGAIHFNEY